MMAPNVYRQNPFADTHWQHRQASETAASGWRLLRPLYGW